MLKFHRCDKIITQRLPSAHSGGGGKASIFLCPDYPHEGANLQPCWICRFCGYFNSRPREGANLIQPGRGSRLLAISIPAPVRGRTCAGPRRAAGCPPISIPAPARGRTRGIPARRRARLFQFPPPRGGEPDARSCLCGCRDFNSRPREGANVFPVIFQTRTKYFNSRPREGANMVERYNFPL